MIPEPPKFNNDDINRCQANNDFRPILFEWYKYVSELALTFACLRKDSPALKHIEDSKYHILIGLLNRCSKLMLANIALSHKGIFGETTTIIDRCIFETSITLCWLCRSKDNEAFQRYIATGLKTEVELQEKIQENINGRNGQIMEIEKRMIASIQKYISASGMNEATIKATTKIPNMASMIEDIGLSRLEYVVGQRIGSHFVHGTWPALRLHYLTKDDKGNVVPRDHDCETHVNQFVYIPMMVLDALSAFVEFVLLNPEQKPILKLFATFKQEIMKINEMVAGNDFKLIEDI